MTLHEVTGWSIPVGVGLVSLVLALSLPIERNRVERLDLFFHGHFGAVAQELIQSGSQNRKHFRELRSSFSLSESELWPGCVH